LKGLILSPIGYIILVMYIIAQFIRYKRKALKLTQEDLSERSGVGLRFIRELERGKNTVRCDKVNQVLAYFGHQLGVEKIEDE